MLTLQLYEPKGIEPFAFRGSTCHVGRSEKHAGAVLKYSRESWWDPTTTMNPTRRSLYRSRFVVEEAILRHLGKHPRIVEYLRSTHDPPGLWLAEARNGDLQLYLEQHNASIGPALRRKWSRPAAEALSCVHDNGVLHCDLRPANCLLDADLNLLLCDFGGSRLRDLSGKGLPDAGFHDLNDEGPPSVKMEVFGLGSLLYTIMTGQVPHAEEVKSGEEYDEVVNGLFKARRFPSVEGIANGASIQACWDGSVGSAADVLHSLEQPQGRPPR